MRTGLKSGRSGSFFALTKKELYGARQWLEKRQSILKKEFKYDYFPVAADLKPIVKDLELNNVILIASFIFLILIVFTILFNKN